MTRLDRAEPIAALAPPHEEEIMLAFLLPLEGAGGTEAALADKRFVSTSNRAHSQRRYNHGCQA